MCLYVWKSLIGFVYCFCLYYQVRGHALDKNGAKLEEPIDLPIKVVDINDNFPVFSHEVFVGSVEELSETGNFILISFWFSFFQDIQRHKWTLHFASCISAITKAHSLADISQVIYVWMKGFIQG